MWSSEQIDLEARKLLADIEKHAPVLWPNTQPQRVYMCDPEAACHVLGLHYLPDSHLGSFGTGTAGMLDRRNRAVLLRATRNFEELRFTAAHEVGHWVLHPGEQLLRDRALSSPGGPGRPLIEQQADQFAGCFLAPPRLLVKAFRARFRVREPMTNTGTICFNLSPRRAPYLESLPRASLDFAVAVATTESFNGESFKSLARLFNISPMAMGIRLREIGLVD
jgi:hypothetical protein